MNNKLPVWLNGQGHQRDIVISSRVRLARNLENYRFPHGMNKEQMQELIRSVEATIKEPAFIKGVGRLSMLKLDELTALDREYLLEQHLISPGMVENWRGRALVTGLEESISILINEEDHFRIQSFISGLNLQDAYIIADKVDDALDGFYEFAFHEQYGYLTSCPTNVGTGIRLSVMLHLPGLSMTGGLAAVQQDLKKDGFVIRGFFGEGSEGYGSLFQISNQFTLGVKEEEVMQCLERRIDEVIGLEKEARMQLFSQKPAQMEDMIYRAYGSLRYARILTAREGMNDLSLVRLGLERGLRFEGAVDYTRLNSLIVLAQPAALQKYFNRLMSADERDRERPKLFREILELGGVQNDLG